MEADAGSRRRSQQERRRLSLRCSCTKEHMLDVMNILGQVENGAGRWMNIIIAVIVGIIFVAVKFGEKKLRQAAQQQAEEQQRKQEALGQRPPVKPPAERQPSPMEPQEAAAGSQRPRRYRPIPPPAGHPYRQAPAAEPLQPVGPVVLHGDVEIQPEPQPSAGAKPLTVEQEISRMQSHLRKLERVRRDRLAVRIPEEADTKAIEARLLKIRPARAPEARRETHALRLDLTDLTRARAAIVFHEILSPPKALCREQEMWEM